MKDPVRYLILTLLTAISILSSTDAQQSTPTEYEVKAAFIYNLAKFVEWPADANTTIDLCILGDDPFGSVIDVIQGKPVREKNIVIKRIKSLQQLKTCQILFISNSEKEHLPQILDALGSSNVLTIGDTEEFAQRGVIINFYVEQDKVRFEINLESAKRAGLSISSKLLKLGRIVKGKS